MKTSKKLTKDEQIEFQRQQKLKYKQLYEETINSSKYKTDKQYESRINQLVKENNELQGRFNLLLIEYNRLANQNLDRWFKLCKYEDELGITNGEPF